MRKYMGRGETDKQTDMQTDQYHDSAWPWGQERVKIVTYRVLVGNLTLPKPTYLPDSNDSSDIVT